MAGQLAGRSALVTGSTSGIGLGIARAFAGAGARVMLNGFGDAGEIKGLLADLRGTGAEIDHHPADLSRPGEIAEMMAATASRFGAIDILVNNAGIQRVAAVDELAPSDWDEVIAVNLSAAFHTTRLALPTMRRRDWGRIINIASVHGLVASVRKSAYVAAKHGLVGFTKAVALETARTGVTVNAICPGWVRTPLVQAQIDARAKERGVTVEEAGLALLGEKQPSFAFVTETQIASLALFLCGDEAAQIRGASLTMDGGWTAQ